MEFEKAPPFYPSPEVVSRKSTPEPGQILSVLQMRLRGSSWLLLSSRVELALAVYEKYSDLLPYPVS
jgi:hypothetical protein